MDAVLYIHPVSWNVPTDILYGSKDKLTSIDTITAFAQKHHASLTVMEDGGRILTQGKNG